MNTFSFNERSYQLTRYPATQNRSLQAWNAVDSYLLEKSGSHLAEATADLQLALYNDRFGCLSCVLANHQPYVILSHHSQKTAIQQNLKKNELTTDLPYLTPLGTLPTTVDVALIKIPKSIELFQLYLYQLQQHLTLDAVVYAGFMTRYFSPQLLEVAAQFFEEVEQSRAQKKARLLILKKPIKTTFLQTLKTLPFKGFDYQQYLGVFSSKHIDYATQFLIEHLSIAPDQHCILDLACGNGILAKTAQLQQAAAKIHLVDDAYLAIASAKLNLKTTDQQREEQLHFHCVDHLQDFPPAYFDMVLCNPPFHFEHEVDNSITLQLFKEVQRVLKANGAFWVVANQHLNYKTHLEQHFNQVEIVATNQKFIIYCATTPTIF